MLKNLFLDIEGELNTARWHRQVNRHALQDEFGYKFDRKLSLKQL